jgi:tetraacyldisaccharide 4'-kinase
MAFFSAESFHEIASGRRRGWLPAAVRGLLATAEPIYGAVIRRKNRRYDLGAISIERIAAPVISVGNLTVGGTGKTPFVVWLAKWFRARHCAVSLISRGYGQKASVAASARRGQPALNDEALEIADLLPDVPHRQDPDRVAAARAELTDGRPRVLILDDAFQHRRIARDLDLVLLDALEPFGYGHLLPRGLLREPIESLQRAQVVALSRSDAVSVERREEIRAIVAQHAPQADWLELIHQPTLLRDGQGHCEPLSAWRGKRVAAFAGIGNPAGFRYTLQTAGLSVVEMRPLADHVTYTTALQESLADWVRSLGALDGVICTHKDLVKVRMVEPGGVPLRALQIELEITRGQERLEERLGAIAQKLPV